MIAGVILAGGRATRMGGGDKCLLPLGGRPILAHVIARLAPQVDALALNANGDPARFAAFGLPVLPDSVAGHRRAAGGRARRHGLGGGAGGARRSSPPPPTRRSSRADLVAGLRPRPRGRRHRRSPWR